MEGVLTQEQIKAIIVATLAQSDRPMSEKDLKAVVDHAEGARTDWLLWEMVIDGKLQPVLDGDEIAFAAPKNRDPTGQ